MEKRITEIFNLLNRKPYLVAMGAATVAARFHCTREEVIEAKKIFREVRKNINGIHNPRILIFDIETSPMKAYVWKRWKENISLDQTISEWFTICWSAKWLGTDIIMGDCLTPFEIKNEDDSRITKSLWSLFDQCDILIAHNGSQFDIPKMNSRFIIHNLPPCSPYKVIDTLDVAKKTFGFSSNKLDALATYFGYPNKDETNFNLWKACLDGDQEALDYMFKYNQKDVVILEKVYIKLRPWIKNHPNANVYLENNKLVCPVCGSTHIVETSDFQYTNISKFKVYRCEHCGAVSRGRVNQLQIKTRII